MVEGTCLELIASKKVSKNNISGTKGVSYHARSNSWLARLVLAHRIYDLGIYRSVEEAATKRREATEKYIKPILERYKLSR